MNRLLSLLVPRRALRWGRLTREPFDWWSDMVVFYGDHTAPPAPRPNGILEIGGVKFTTNSIAVRIEPGILAPFIDWSGEHSPIRMRRFVEPGPYTDVNRAAMQRAIREGMDMGEAEWRRRYLTEQPMPTPKERP